jgi:opacity protein-like surface antigen
MSYHVGIGALRSEVSKGADLIDEFGIDYGIRLNFSLPDPRYLVYAEASYGTVNAHLDIEMGGGALERYKTYNQMGFLGLGVRYQINQNLKRYNPFPGQFIPFVGLGSGMAWGQNSINKHMIIAEGYELSEANFMDFTIQTELGARVMINDRLYLEWLTTFRRAFQDQWDGIKGNTGINDWFVRTNLGLGYKF